MHSNAVHMPCESMCLSLCLRSLLITTLTDNVSLRATPGPAINSTDINIQEEKEECFASALSKITSISTSTVTEHQICAGLGKTGTASNAAQTAGH